MQSLNDDELKVIREYVEDVPIVKEEVHHIHAKVDEINTRLTVMESVVKDHEKGLRNFSHRKA